MTLFTDAKQRAAALKGRSKKIADVMLSFFDDGGGLKSGPNGSAHNDFSLEIARMKKTLGWDDDKKISDFFKPGSGEYKALAALTGDSSADFITRVWMRRADYPADPPRLHSGGSRKKYDVHAGPVSFRTDKYHTLFFDQAVVPLLNRVKGAFEGFDMKAWVDGDNLEKGGRYTISPENHAEMFKFRPGSDDIACWLDDPEYGDAALERAKAIIADTTGTKILSPQLINALLEARRHDAHEMAGGILLNAGLQEPLRMWVVSGAYSGAREAFLYIFKLIIDNNLLRYSSVVKGIARWLHFDKFDKPSSPQTRKCIEDAYRCLTDEQYRKVCLAADNPLQVYVALWAVSLGEVADIFDPIREIVEKGPRHRKVPALYVLNQLNVADVNFRAAETILANADDRRDAPLMALTLNALNWPRMIAFQETPSAGVRSGDMGTPRLTRDEVRRLYELLKAATADFPARGDGERRADIVLGKTETVSYSLDMVLKKMIDLARRPADLDKRWNVGDLNAMRYVEEQGYLSSWSAGEDDAGAPDLAKEWGLAASPPKRFGLKFVADQLDAPYPDGWNLRDDLCGMMGRMDGATRRIMVSAVIRDGSGSPVQRAALVGMFGDRATGGRWGTGGAATAYAYTAGLELTEDEYAAVENGLSSKDGSLRQLLFFKLLGRDPAGLGRSLQRLLSAKNANMRSAGAELLQIAAKKKDDPEYAKMYSECASLAADKKITAAVKADAEKPSALAASEQTQPAGLGLFDPDAERASFAVPDLPGVRTEDDCERLFAIDVDNMQRLLNEFDAFVEKNADYEYETMNWQGGIETVMLGSQPLREEYRGGEGGVSKRSGRVYSFDEFPFGAEWRKMYTGCGITPQSIVVFNRLRRFPDDGRNWGSGSMSPGWVPRQLLSKFMMAYKTKMIGHYDDKGVFKKHRYESVIDTLLFTAEQEAPAAEKYAAVRRICLAFLQMDIENKEEIFSVFNDWFNDWKKLAFSGDDALFTDYFTSLYQYTFGPGGFDPARWIFSARGMARAFRLGLLPEGDFTRVLVQSGLGNAVLPQLTSLDPGRKLLAEAPGLGDVVARVANRAVELEIPRGDLPTATSKLAQSVAAYKGAKYFVDILSRMGNTPFERAVLRRPRVVRDDSYGWRLDVDTRKKMLSHLLRSCYPAEDDDAQTLTALVKSAGLSEQRLVDGAMFAPQWVGMVEECLGWKGLESMCWFFHAHVAEALTPETETMAARYTDMRAEDMNAGACDAAWFRGAYGDLGPKRYAVVYNASKYIANGANHRRAQLFAEAMVGKLKAADVAREILDKRNQNNVLSDGLIPWDKKNPEKDQLERYMVLQEFNRTRGKVGAQRRATEERVAATALETMARNAGYDSATRFAWKMEAALAASRDLYGRHDLGNDSGVSARLESDGDGGLTVKMEKNGKPLKSVPAALKNDPQWLELKETEKSWKEQQSRTRQALERAMIHGDAFEMTDLAEWSNNPAFKFILGKVLFKAGKKVDFLDALLGKKVKGQAVVAHPVHLKEEGSWEKWQRALFDRQMKQPFKQVFRELYLPTADELKSGTSSSRYANYQVALSRGNGVMKARDWVPQYDGGYRKIFAGENISAWVGLTAGGSSLADDETAQVGTIFFSEWRGDGAVPLDKVPPVLYSEVMRDVDLLVSVAFAGSGSPDTSQSTMEMRFALAREAVRLFKLDNVTFNRAHALIQGTHGVYSVHMGSGIMHKQATGALMVFAIPAQERGRVFLPFMDDDPRTAEILTKILMFARDGEIKDPAILGQIKG